MKRKLDDSHPAKYVAAFSRPMWSESGFPRSSKEVNIVSLDQTYLNVLVNQGFMDWKPLTREASYPFKN